MIYKHIVPQFGNWNRDETVRAAMRCDSTTDGIYSERSCLTCSSSPSGFFTYVFGFVRAQICVSRWNGFKLLSPKCRCATNVLPFIWISRRFQLTSLKRCTRTPFAADAHDECDTQRQNRGMLWPRKADFCRLFCRHKMSTQLWQERTKSVAHAVRKSININLKQNNINAQRRFAAQIIVWLLGDLAKW